ncbi:MAG: hypothetical protein FWD28_07085 [Treponema sp.]|nr:hypothetical protein [Treponema sp.]
MKYSELEKLLEKAINKGIKTVTENPYESIWSSGYGWQEQWKPHQKEDRKAGVYASCEGIILLSNNIRDEYKADKSLIEKIYLNHLCKIFNEKVAPENTENESKIKDTRTECFNTTFKLANFIKASSFIDKNILDLDLVKSMINKLFVNYDENKKGFKSTSYEKETCVFATAMAITALAVVKKYFNDKKIDNCIKNCLDGFNNILSNICEQNKLDEVITETNKENIMILWAISCMPEYFKEKKDVFDIASVKCKYFLENFKIPADNRLVKKINITNEINDFFSANTHIIFLYAVICFMEIGIINKKVNLSILESVYKILDMIKDKGFFSTTYSQPTGKIEFWENFQAIEMLKTYHKFLTNKIKNKSKECFMIIEPKVFTKTEFVQDDKLVCVIMPFVEEWSNDVYKVSVDALEPVGYNVWRADLITKDDVIIQEIWNQINKSKFVIADCTNKNPNVFYELGIAHALGKPAFMCTQKSEDIPFDIKFIKYFTYGLQYKELQDLIKQLKQFAESIE